MDNSNSPQQPKKQLYQAENNNNANKDNDSTVGLKVNVPIEHSHISSKKKSTQNSINEIIRNSSNYNKNSHNNEFSSSVNKIYEDLTVSSHAEKLSDLAGSRFKSSEKNDSSNSSNDFPHVSLASLHAALTAPNPVKSTRIQLWLRVFRQHKTHSILWVVWWTIMNIAVLKLAPIISPITLFPPVLLLMLATESMSKQYSSEETKASNRTNSQRTAAAEFLSARPQIASLYQAYVNASNEHQQFLLEEVFIVKLNSELHSTPKAINLLMSRPAKTNFPKSHITWKPQHNKI